MIDMQDELIKRARNNKLLFRATVAAILVLGALNLMRIYGA